MDVAALFRYPVKSLRGQALDQVKVHDTGFEGDRRWMVITPEGQFVSIREQPALTGLSAAYEGGRLVITGPDGARIEIDGAEDETIDVALWNDTGPCRLVGAAADQFISGYLGKKVRLAYLEEPIWRGQVRYADFQIPQYNLADAGPILLVNIASLAALNSRLSTPVSINRFRPNIVMGSHVAWTEYTLDEVVIGRVRLKMVSPCPRCIVPSFDEHSGERTHGNELLGTLRKVAPATDRRAYFGVYLLPVTRGDINIGDPID